jgi:thioredoxin-related protein
MSRFLVVFIIFISSLYASGTPDYKEAVEKARKDGKHVLFVLTTQYCPWCNRLKNGVLETPEVKEAIKKGYVLTIVDRDRDKFPDKFYSRLVPTTFIIDPYTQEEVDMVIGYVNRSAFLEKLNSQKTLDKD